jgi:hypothetical protein
VEMRIEPRALLECSTTWATPPVLLSLVKYEHYWPWTVSSTKFCHSSVDKYPPAHWLHSSHPILMHLGLSWAL